MKLLRYIMIMLIISTLLINTIDSIILEAKTSPKADKDLLANYEKQGTTNIFSAEGITYGSRDRDTYRTSYVNGQISNQFPLNANKNIIYPNMDEFYVNESVCIWVQIECPKGCNFNRIDVWEYSDPHLNIINCSYPIRTSCIEDVIRYQRSEPCSFYSCDFTNTTYIFNKLYNHNLSRYLVFQFSNESNKILFDSGESNYNIYYNHLLMHKFNDLLRNTDLYNSIDFRKTRLSEETHQALRRLRYGNLQEQDIYLCNRLILEDLFPEGIVRGHESLVESFNFNDERNIIHIPIENMYSRENILFRYYVNTTQPGKYKASTVIKIIDKDNRNSDYLLPIEIQFKNKTPIFDVNLEVINLELNCGGSEKIKYYINYLGGASDICYYDVILDNSTQYNLEKGSFKNQKFLKGESVVLETSIQYPNSSTFNLPGLTIDNVNYVFDERVNVEYGHIKWWNDNNSWVSNLLTSLALLFMIFELCMWKKQSKP